MSVEVGAKAPDFTLPNQDREPVTLSEQLVRGPVVLAFFPAAFSGTCQAEMCKFRDSASALNTVNAKVLGISVDTFFALKAWGDQQKLNFPAAQRLQQGRHREVRRGQPGHDRSEGISPSARYSWSTRAASCVIVRCSRTRATSRTTTRSPRRWRLCSSRFHGPGSRFSSCQRRAGPVLWTRSLLGSGPKAGDRSTVRRSSMPETAVAAAERTLPHNLEAERSVLGAILVHNDAFNLAAQVDRQRRLLPRRAPAHLRPDGRAQRAPRRHRLRHAEGGARARRPARRSGRPGLHRVAGRRRAARDQRRVLRADRQGEEHARET